MPSHRGHLTGLLRKGIIENAFVKPREEVSFLSACEICFMWLLDVSRRVRPSDQSKRTQSGLSQCTRKRETAQSSYWCASVTRVRIYTTEKKRDHQISTIIFWKSDKTHPVKRVTQVLEAGFKVRVLTYPGRCLTVALLSALQLSAKFGTGSIAYIVETYEAMPPSYFSLHLQQQVANDTIVRLKRPHWVFNDWNVCWKITSYNGRRDTFLLAGISMSSWRGSECSEDFIFLKA